MWALQTLTLARNRLSGLLPATMPMSVTFLDMSDNRISGLLPVWTGNNLVPGTAQFIFLRNNSLSSTIPPYWLPLATNGGDPESRYLELNNNRLSGVVPQDLALLTTCVELNARVNRISGSIGHLLQVLLPQCQTSESIVVQMPILQYLVLDGNPLTGELRDILALSPPRPLSVLILEDSAISGTVPSTIGNKLPHLQYLVASATQISGHVPPLPTSLEQCVFDRAKLSGSIPAAISLMSRLKGFQLNAMRISGWLIVHVLSAVWTEWHWGSG